jgi:hypothetical protein
MKTITFFTIVLFCLVSLDCSKEEAPTAPTPTGIYGSWNWIESTGGISGNQVLTPASVGYSIRISFTTDGTFQRFRNDTLVGTSGYSISRQKTDFSTDSLDVIVFQDSAHFIRQFIYSASSDSLALGDLCYDCFSHVYTRMK